MDCYVTLILLFFVSANDSLNTKYGLYHQPSGFSYSSCSRFPLRTYYYINSKMTWANAQHYCRVNYTDLATIESKDDISRVKRASSDSWSWIGLKDDPKSWKEAMGNDTNSWRWSATGETSKTGYQNWRFNEPNNYAGNENCVLMASSGLWRDVSCHGLKGFVCYNVTEQNEKTYVFVSALKMWKSAQAYCREYYTDLPVIENTVENNAVFSAKSANAEAWIGLYRVPWTWSDKTQSSFRSWRSGKPNNYAMSQFCVGQRFGNEWEDLGCNTEYTFICHQVSKFKTMVRMKIETAADLTDPPTNTQILQKLGAVLRSQGWTDFNLQWKIQPRKQ